LNRVARKRVELLDAHDGDAVVRGAPFVAHEFGPDMPAAQRDPPYAFGMVAHLMVVDERLKRAIREVSRARGGQWAAQQALRRHDDQWARRASETSGLTPQQEVVLGRGSAVRDTHVVLRREFEEALQSTARMVRPLTLPGVWQQQHEPRDEAPFGFARDDELVDDH